MHVSQNQSSTDTTGQVWPQAVRSHTHLVLARPATSMTQEYIQRTVDSCRCTTLCTLATHGPSVKEDPSGCQGVGKLVGRLAAPQRHQQLWCCCFVKAYWTGQSTWNFHRPTLAHGLSLKAAPAACFSLRVYWAGRPLPRSSRSSQRLTDWPSFPLVI